MDIFIGFTKNFSKFLGIVAAILLIVAVLVVCQMVFVRYVLHESTSWQTEFVSYTLIASTFLGSPYVLLVRGHVNVELLPVFFSGKIRFTLALLAYSLSAALCILLAYLSVEFWYEAWEKDWRSDTIWEPKLWKAYAAMPIGFIAISLQYIADLLNLITGREQPFGMKHEILGGD